MRIGAHFKNTLTNYTKSDLLTRKSLLLPVVWDKNGLLFTKQLHMMNTIIGYSLAKTIVSTNELCGTHQANLFVYNHRDVELESESAQRN